MKKVFMIGDFRTNNGPANANRNLYNALKKKENIKVSQQTNKISRLLEMLVKIVWCDVYIMCSATKLNDFALFIGKIFKKKSILIIHGRRAYEYLKRNNDLKDERYKKLLRQENTIYFKSDMLVAVSKMFCDDLKKEFPEYEKKIEFIYNVVEMKQENDHYGKKRERKKTILSTGGGSRNKNNIAVAKAINYLNQQYDEDFRYIVLGPENEDGKEIKSISCVTYMDYLAHHEVIELMNNTDIYVQNSSYDTFGLAVVEAFLSGCDILIAEKVGCKTLFSNITEKDIIYDSNNIKEIGDKIYNIYLTGNNEQLTQSFDSEKVSARYIAEKMSNIIRRI